MKEFGKLLLFMAIVGLFGIGLLTFFEAVDRRFDSRSQSQSQWDQAKEICYSVDGRDYEGCVRKEVDRLEREAI